MELEHPLARPQTPTQGDVTKLSYDVLVKILALLDIFTLRTARLVCRAFRAASIPCVTCLSYNCAADYFSAAPPPDPPTSDTLAQRLRSFRYIVGLDLSIALPSDASMLELPAVRSALCKLKLVSGTPDAASTLGLLAARLTAATCLTVLEIGPTTLQSPDAGAHLACLLAACPTVRGLALEGYAAGDPGRVFDAVVGASSVQSLRCCAIGPELLKHVASNAGRLTSLRSLDGIFLEQGADVEGLAGLTQLTRLRVCIVFGGSPAQLSRLSALQSLEMNWPASNFPILHKVVGPMRQLRRLHLHNWHADLGAMDAILAGLPMLTSLRTGDAYQPESSEPFLARGWGGLRWLHLSLLPGKPEDAATLFQALTRLEHLELSCDERECRELSSHLTGLPGLTHLRISSKCASEQCPSGRVLDPLPRLSLLCLDGVLNPERWNEDVANIAALTGLRTLAIRPHGPYPPPQGVWWDEGAVTRAQVQPLTALRHLERLAVCGPWLHGLEAPDFKEALRAVRLQMGLPETAVLAHSDAAQIFRARVPFT